MFRFIFSRIHKLDVRVRAESSLNTKQTCMFITVGTVKVIIHPGAYLFALFMRDISLN